MKKPLHDFVMIQLAKKDAVSKGGIVLPETAKDKPNKGTVVAVGDGKRDNNGCLIPLSVQVGQTVYFQPYGGHVLEAELIAVPENQIFAFEDDSEDYDEQCPETGACRRVRKAGK